MATVSFNVNDTLVPLGRDAFDEAFPGRPAGTTKQQWVEEHCRRFYRSVIRGVEADKVAKAARDTKIAELEALVD